MQIELSMLDCNTWNHLILQKQRPKTRLKPVTNELIVYKSYLFNIYV